MGEGAGTFGAERLVRLSEGTALPEGVTKTDIPTLWEVPTEAEPGGWVLYMDGHVEWVDYPGKFPMTERFVRGLAAVREELAVPESVRD